MTQPVDPEPGPLAPAFLAIVGLGGIVGTTTRYGLARWLPAGTGFPWGTFTANLLGTFILGVLLERLTRHGPDLGINRKLRLLVGTGFCGGLTTYSTFALDTDLLVKAHNSNLAVTYALATILAGLAAAAIGVLGGVWHHRMTT
jgi:CrcB protein